MAIRVEPSEVKDIIATDVSELVIKNIMIPAASNFVDVHLASAGHSDLTLKHIELYLAAHLVALSEEKGGIIEDEYGDSRTRFADIFSDGFRSTRFGQMAINLDTSGALASKGSAKMKAEFRVV